MSRTLLKVAGEQNDPLRVKVFPHDFVDNHYSLIYFRNVLFIGKLK